VPFGDGVVPPPDDLTPRARIRDAAMAEFAEHGFKAATIKGIAEVAGVSTGLVQHHFGTKARLRRACDDLTAARIREQLDLVDHLDAEVADPDLGSVLYDASPLQTRYLIRLLTDDPDGAAWLFDEMAAGTERFLSSVRPDLFPSGSEAARDAATVMEAMHLGTAVLHAQLARRMGASLLEGESSPRIGMVMLDVYKAMAAWVASETGQQGRSAVAACLERLVPGERGQEHSDD